MKKQTQRFINKTLQQLPSTVVGIETTKNGIGITMSYDKQFSKYFSEYYNSSRPMSYEETAIKVCELFERLLIKTMTVFGKGIKREPKFMIIYRTGKNDSGLRQLKESEIPLEQSEIEILSKVQSIHL